jgi:hypothetical protein
MSRVHPLGKNSSSLACEKVLAEAVLPALQVLEAVLLEVVVQVVVLVAPHLNRIHRQLPCCHQHPRDRSCGALPDAAQLSFAPPSECSHIEETHAFRNHDPPRCILGRHTSLQLRDGLPKLEPKGYENNTRWHRYIYIYIYRVWGKCPGIGCKDVRYVHVCERISADVFVERVVVRYSGGVSALFV